MPRSSSCAHDSAVDIVVDPQISLLRLCCCRRRIFMQLGTVLAENRRDVVPLGGTVMKEAERRGWIKPFSNGQYIYAPPWVNLVRILQDLVRRRAIEHLGFE